MELGTANYEGSNKKKRFQIKDGDNVYRILPPMGSLAKKGHYSQYYSVVWGYENAKKQKRPFADCRQTNYNTKMVEVESDAYLKSTKINNMLKELKEKKANGETVNEDVLKRTEDMARKFNIEGKHYFNVVNLQGEIGVLKLGARAKDMIKEEIKKLTAKGIDPLSIDNGRYFNISRTGRGNNTIYQVTVYKEQRVVEGGEIAEFDKKHVMDASFIARLSTEAFDLGSLYPRPTPEQVSQIVAGADPDVVLGAQDEAGDDAPDTEGVAAGADQAKQQAEALAQEALRKAAQEQEAKQQAAAAKAAEAAKLAAEASQAKEASAGNTATAAGASTQLSDEEFLKQMGL